MEYRADDQKTEELFAPGEKVTKLNDDAHTAMLVVVNGQYKGLVIELDKESMSCGRAPENEIFFPIDQLSRKHFLISYNKDGHFIQDTNSTNGTFLNNNKLEVETLLVENDLICIGSVCMKYVPYTAPKQSSDQIQESGGITDKLTGCFTQEYFKIKLDNLVMEHAATQSPLYMLAFEIDDLDLVKDQHGQEGVDFMLASLCDFIRDKCVRSNDFFARYNDHVFSLLLGGISASKAKEIAERMRVLVEKRSFKYQNHLLKSTLSIGVSGYIQTITRADEITTQAEKALLQSKANGFNNVTVYGASTFAASEETTQLL